MNLSNLPPIQDLSKKTISQLKVLLVEHNVNIPPKAQKKQFYVDLAMQSLYNNQNYGSTPATPVQTSQSFHSQSSLETPVVPPRGEVSCDLGYGFSPNSGFPYLVPIDEVPRSSSLIEQFPSPME
ncbi:hypothetical protein RCL1_006960 [Eukaryota sp. TZLM3-RCL]